MKPVTHQKRLWIIGFFFLIILTLLVWRMYDLTILHRQFLQGQGNARSIRIIDIPGYRGMIVDRLGSPLAVSAPVKSLWVNPKEFNPEEQKLKQLANLLNFNVKQLSQKIHHQDFKEFLYLKRQLPPELVNQIKNLEIAGLNFQDEYKRYYPEAQSSAHLIGFTDIDDKGIEGLELAYNEWLMGQSGKKRVLKDRSGAIVEELDVLKQPRQGNDLRLSIDKRIQYFAYLKLQETIEHFSAKSGSVVVLDSQTGEILALVNAPSYNPNARNRYTLNDFRNIAVTDIFEPGSVMKPFTIASVLESGTFNSKSMIDTHPGWMSVQGHLIRDLKNFGKLDVTGILKHSSNVGVSKMLLKNPPEQLIELLAECGMGQRSELAFPGESNGILTNILDANPFVQATLGFGYGLSVTSLQLAKSYLIFANHGRMIPVSLIYNDKIPEGRQVISEKTANEVLNMMQEVIEDSAKLAKVPGYLVAGKTGTARLASKNGYHENKHIASFVGIAPVTNPKLIVAVVIHEPTRLGYYAGSVAAPLFAKVMSLSLHMLEVPPDDKSKTL